MRVSLLLILCLLSHNETPPIGWLIIPSISTFTPLYTIPIEDNAYQMGDKAGHLEGTTWVDDGWGRVALAGHNPGIFARVPLLRRCDRIIILSRSSAYEFYVRQAYLIHESQTNILAPTTEFSLVLITCATDTYRYVIVSTPNAC